MPKITLPILPINGAPLYNKGRKFTSVEDPYTRATYARLDGGADDSGLMSQINGRLSTVNLDPYFVLEDYHIQPEQASLARIESMLTSSTVYGSGIPKTENSLNFFALPGCSLRWYQPYDTSMSLMQWSLFFSYNSWRGIYKDKDGTHHSGGVNSIISLRCRLDDDVVTGSTRTLGQNMFHPISPGAVDRPDQTGPGMGVHDFYKEQYLDRSTSLVGTAYSVPAMGHNRFENAAPEDPSKLMMFRGGNPRYIQTEAHTGHQMDLHHMATLTKGYHEISIECSIESPEGEAVYLQNAGSRRKGMIVNRGYFDLVGKLSLGIRNVRVLNLL
jgi:hypothetical protein